MLAQYTGAVKLCRKIAIGNLPDHNHDLHNHLDLPQPEPRPVRRHPPRRPLLRAVRVADVGACPRTDGTIRVADVAPGARRRWNQQLPCVDTTVYPARQKKRSGSCILDLRVSRSC